MSTSGCELTCEIRHGSDLTFEEVGEAENEMRHRLQALLEPLEPSCLEVRATGDDFSFVGSTRRGDPDGLRALCWELASLVDQGARGRLVAVQAGFGPVRVWEFSAAGVDETVVPPGA